MATAAELMPQVKQHLITTPAGRAALGTVSLLTSIEVFDKHGDAAASGLRLRSKFSKIVGAKPVVLQPHKSIRSTLLAALLPGPVVTYCETTGSFLATKRVPRVAVLHESDRIALLLEGLGFPRQEILGRRPSMPQNTVPLATPNLPWQTDLSQKIKWIGVAPGSVWATKRWPAAKFTTLCQLLLDDPSVGIVLLGSAEESAICASLEEACLRTRPFAKSRLINLSGRTKLQDLPTIYQGLSLLLANDSSPIHYASAFNVPTVAIFGATVPALGFGPLAQNSVVIEKQLACRPCSDHGPKSCPLTHFKCMNEIDVDDVKNAVVRILEMH